MDLINNSNNIIKNYLNNKFIVYQYNFLNLNKKYILKFFNNKIKIYNFKYIFQKEISKKVFNLEDTIFRFNKNEIKITNEINNYEEIFYSENSKIIEELIWNIKDILNLNFNLEKNILETNDCLLKNNINILINDFCNYYLCNLHILKTLLIFKLNNIEINDNSIFPFTLNTKSRSNDIILIEIKKINLIKIEYFGFIINYGESEFNYKILIQNNHFKQKLINLISENSKKYFNKEIEFNENISNNFIFKQIFLDTLNNFYYLHECIKVSLFGELFTIKIGLNDTCLYEINSKNFIINKYKINSIKKIIKNNDYLESTEIILNDNISQKYIFKDSNSDNFISFILFFHKENLDFENYESLNFEWNKYEMINIISQKENKINKLVVFNDTKDLYEYNYHLLNSFKLDDIKCDLSNFLYKKLSLFLINNNFNLDDENNYNNLFFDLIKIFNSFFTDERKKNYNRYFKKKEKENKKKNNIITEILNKVDIYSLDFNENLLNKIKSLEIEKVDYSNYKEDEFYFISEVFEYLEIILKFLSLCLTNSSIYKFVATNTLNDSKNKYKFELEKFLEITIHLSLSYFYENLSKIAGLTICLITKFSGKKLNKKIETINKSMIWKNNYLKNSFQLLIVKCFKYNFIDFKKEIQKYIFQILSILEIYENYLFNRKNTTQNNDLNLILSYINNNLFFMIIVKLNYTCNLFINYKVSLIFNSIFHCLVDKIQIKKFQEMILNHSVLILRHLEICVSNFPYWQKQLSIVFIYQCLIDNKKACNLLFKLIPKPLFRKVQNLLNDISKWTLIEWENLFKNINCDFDNEFEQWNQCCRDELINDLIKAQSNFYENWKELKDEDLKLINHNFNLYKNKNEFNEYFDKIIQLRWNFEEYTINYKYLIDKLPVWKYYITKIYEDSIEPKLIVNITYPIKFWEELINSFMLSTNNDIKIKYLKVMILIYKKYFDSIKEINWINFINKDLVKDNFFWNYYILQFFFIIMKVKDPIILNQNIIIFWESNGFNNIKNYMIHMLYSCPTDLAINQNKYYNFTDSNLMKDSNISNIYHNKIIICIKLLKICIHNTRNQIEGNILWYPPPICRKIAFEEKSINLIIDCLNLNSSKMVLKNILKFIKGVYINKYSYKLLYEKPQFWLYLMNIISKDLLPLISDIIKNLFEIAVQDKYESILLIKDTLKNFSIKNNYLEVYYNLDIGINIQIISFPPLCFLPIYFWYKIINNNYKEFEDIFFSNEYIDCYIYWNSDTRNKFFENINLNINSINSKLKASTKSNNNCISLIKNKELWNLKKIYYSEFSKFIIVGPIILNKWVEIKEFKYLVNNNHQEFTLLIGNLTLKELKITFEIFPLLKLKKPIKMNFNIIKTYLKAFTILIKENSNVYIEILEIFSEFIKLWNDFYLECLSNHEYSKNANSIKNSVDIIAYKIIGIVLIFINNKKDFEQKLFYDPISVKFKKNLLNVILICFKIFSNNEIYVKFIKILIKIMHLLNSFKLNDKYISFFSINENKFWDKDYKDIKNFLSIFPNPLFNIFLEFIYKIIQNSDLIYNQNNKLKNNEVLKNIKVINIMDIVRTKKMNVDEFIYLTKILLKYISSWIKVVHNFSKYEKNLNIIIRYMIFESSFIYLVKFFEIYNILLKENNKNLVVLRNKIKDLITILFKIFQFIVIYLFINCLKNNESYEKYFESLYIDDPKKKKSMNSIIENLKNRGLEMNFNESEMLILFFNKIEKIFGKNLLFKIIFYFKDIDKLFDYFNKIYNGIYKKNYILNREILNEIVELFINQSKCFINKNSDYSNLIYNFKSKFLENETLINGIYISSYIKNSYKFSSTETKNDYFKKIMDIYLNLDKKLNKEQFEKITNCLICFIEREILDETNNLEIALNSLIKPNSIENNIYIEIFFEKLKIKNKSFIKTYFSNFENVNWLINNLSDISKLKETNFENYEKNKLFFEKIVINLFKIAKTNIFSQNRIVSIKILLIFWLYIFDDNFNNYKGKILNWIEFNYSNFHLLNLFIKRIKLYLYDNISVNNMINNSVENPYLVYNKLTKEFIIWSLNKKLIYLNINPENKEEISFDFNFLFPEQIENDLIIDDLSLKMILNKFNILETQELLDVLDKIFKSISVIREKYLNSYYKNKYFSKIQLMISVVVLLISNIKLSIILDYIEKNDILLRNFISIILFFNKKNDSVYIEFLILQLYSKMLYNKIDIYEEGYEFINKKISLLTVEELNLNPNKVIILLNLYFYIIIIKNIDLNKWIDFNLVLENSLLYYSKFKFDCLKKIWFFMISFSIENSIINKKNLWIIQNQFCEEYHKILSTNYSNEKFWFAENNYYLDILNEPEIIINDILVY